MISKSEPLIPTVVLPPGRAPVASVRELEMLARLMDGAWEIPGTRIRFGIDAIIGLLPGLGDTLSALVSIYILATASRYGLPRVTVLRMALNIAIDVVVGALPFVGDLFDVFWRANIKNVALLQQHVVATPLESRRARRWDWLVVLAASSFILLALGGALTLTFWAIMAIGRAIF